MIYFVQVESSGPIKIGFTASRNVRRRVWDLQAASPWPLRLLATRPGSVSVEKSLHRRFAESRLHGEWFHPVAELKRLIRGLKRKRDTRCL